MQDFDRTRLSLVVGLVVAAASVWLLAPSQVEACGCLSPPAQDDADFAVNQQSEQIIFEVNDNGTITAHVHIRYAGDPAQFAWLVPVPSVPDLDVTSELAFGILDGLTSPRIEREFRSLCPIPQFYCSERYCSENNSLGNNDTTNNDDGGDGERRVEVIRREQVGDYDTVIFNAEESDLAVQWLQDEGFVVNDTMIPYMQPYLDGGMLFVASRLIAGAGLDSIKPLKMTYEGTNPMIPLQLTAVASEPHLTVTAYILGETTYVASNAELVSIDREELTFIGARDNYPMLLARTVDESESAAFVAEFDGRPRSFLEALDPSGCCTFAEEGNDRCSLVGDGLCQCPLGDADAADCASEPELVEGYTALDRIFGTHTKLTRLTTRLSPEEMNFDPVFEPGAVIGARNSFSALRFHLDGCSETLGAEELEAYEAIEAKMACATTYCDHGQCAVSGDSGGCVCDEGYVARRYTDLDGLPSKTCIPAVPTIDLAAGGFSVPDVCVGVDCGAGSCLPVGGFPTCDCDEGNAAILDDEGALRCAPISAMSGGTGARNYSRETLDIEVCAPASPASCGLEGFLVSTGSAGVSCPENALEDPLALVVPSIDACFGESRAGEGERCTQTNKCTFGECKDGFCFKPCSEDLECYSGVCKGGFCEIPDKRRDNRQDEEDAGCSLTARQSQSATPILLVALTLLWGLVALPRR